MLVHWAGWAVDRRCPDTALGHADRGPTLGLDPQSDADGGRVGGYRAQSLA